MDKTLILVALIGIVIFLAVGYGCEGYKRYILSKYRNPHRFKEYLSVYDTICTISRVGAVLWLGGCVTLMFFNIR